MTSDFTLPLSMYSPIKTATGELLIVNVGLAFPEYYDPDSPFIYEIITRNIEDLEQYTVHMEYTFDKTVQIPFEAYIELMDNAMKGLVFGYGSSKVLNVLEKVRRALDTDPNKPIQEILDMLNKTPLNQTDISK